MKVWIEGEIFEGAEARIPVTDHGFLYGDGVFEGLRIRKGRIFRLEAHLERLEVSARALGLEIPGGTEAVRAIVLETVRAHGTEDAYVRLIVTRGDGPLGVDPTSCPRARIVCIADALRIYPPEKRSRGIDLVTVSLRRPPPDVLDPGVKSLNYLNSALAKLEARRGGADEGLLLNRSGTVAEASVANVFVVQRDRVETPPTTDGALAGITRGAILELAEREGLRAAERTLGRLDLLAADEVFLTGTGAGIVPVRSLDGRNLKRPAPGPITQRLTKAFQELVATTGTPVRPG